MKSKRTRNIVIAVAAVGAVVAGTASAYGCLFGLPC